MASKFKGRDYSTLRSEIIEFLRQRLDSEWDYTNLADPVVIFAESLARVGDQLHFTIDELRRECDVATAKRASSIYSYAMREGYKMFLPRASFGTLSINTSNDQDGMLHLHLSKFDEIKVVPYGETLYVANDNISGKDYAIDADLHSKINPEYANSLANYYDDAGNIINEKRNVYQAYVEDIYSKTQRVRVVLGEKKDFNFTYSDINTDSTIELQDVLIDRNLVRLSYSNSAMGESYKELTYVDDVISSGFNFLSYTLTPKFIGGAITLCIEFPTNYKDIFDRDLSTKFRFEYILTKNIKIDPSIELTDNPNAFDFGTAITVVSGYEDEESISENGLQYLVDVGDGIKGYTEYESANVTRENYKRFIQSYAALLTKDDYFNYIRAYTTSYCRIYDHSDMYKNPPVLPNGTNLLPRVIYAITDSVYNEREALWYDLKERSSRSDCIVLTPFGKDPYAIVIEAECNLIGTSAASITMQIEKELFNYYADSVGEKIPKVSMINYLVHKSSDKVVRMNSLIVRDSTYGNIDTTFNKVSQLSNTAMDSLYNEFLTDADWETYKTPLIDDTQTSSDYRYYFRGKSYIDSSNKIYTQAELDKANSELSSQMSTSEVYYNKYPKITNLVNNEYKSEYSDFPDSFPQIYCKNSTGWNVVTEYSNLVEHQTVYGELDSPDWDYQDNKIFYPESFANEENVIVTGEGGIASEPTMMPLWIHCSYTLDGNDYVGYLQVYRSEEKVIKCVEYIDNEWVEVDFKFENIPESDNLSKVLTQVSETLRYITTVDLPLFEQPDINSDIVKDINGDDIIVESQDLSSDVDPVLISAVSAVYFTNTEIKSDYVKHHYMVPVLNKVVVLIKAVSTNQN